jgi:hypothetical protein
MRIWVLTVGMILIGVTAGAGSAWLEFAGTINQFEPHNLPAGTPILEPDRIGPRVSIVDGTDYDFGVGQRQSAMHRSFVFRNEGDEPLQLTQGPTTCKCTLSELKTGDVPPGGTTEVRLDWKLVTEGEQFRQTADIHTNDPRQPTVTLTIHGIVTDLLRLEPGDVVLSNVPANEGATTTLHLLGFDIQDLQVLSHEYTNQETASFFSLDWRPATKDELRGKSGASIGLVGTLTVKPGLPLGPINQTIQLQTNVPKADKLELAISGSVVSDISIVGPSLFSEKQSTVVFGGVEQSRGAKTTLRILVKGPQRREVKLEVQEVDPADVLQVSLGDVQEINAGAVLMYPLEIRILPGSRLISRLGSEQAKPGKIVIETTHPTVKKIPINVKFAVD